MHNGGGRRRVFFHHFYLRRISLWRAAGGRSEHTGAERSREWGKINRRPPAVLFLILKRALCIKWRRTEHADDSTESCLSQFAKKVVDNTCRARSLDFLHTAKPLSPAESAPRLQTLSNGLENLEKRHVSTRRIRQSNRLKTFESKEWWSDLFSAIYVAMKSFHLFM